MCVCTRALSLQPNPASQDLGRRLAPWAVRSPPAKGSKRTKDCLPTPSPPHTPLSFKGAAMIGLKGEEEGQIKGRKGVGWGAGLWRKDRRSKTGEVRRKRKPPLLLQIDSRQCPPSHLCSELLSRMPPPWDAQPKQKGSGALGRHKGPAAGDHWACLALQGELLFPPAHPLATQS